LRVAARADIGADTPTTPGPAWFPLALYRGDSHHWQYVLWGDSAKTQPIDLTDVVVAAQMRDRSDGTTIVQLDCSVRLPNTIDVLLDAVSSATAPIGQWDLQLTYSDGRVITVVRGNVSVTGDITP
jgi:hypothetical protein